MKVLIMHSGAAGEIIFSTVLVRALKIQLEDAAIFYLTHETGKRILAENPYLEAVWASNNGGDAEASRNQEYDYVLDLDGSFGSWLQTLRFKGKVLRLDQRKWKKWLLTRIKINKMIPMHLIDQYIAVAAPLNVRNDGMRPDFQIPYRDEVPPDWLPEAYQKGYVVFCISAPYNTRKLPVERMITLCDRINKPVILLGHSEDYESGEVVQAFFKRGSSDDYEEGLKELNKKAIVYNACEKFSFNQMASVIKNSRFVFTFDNDFIAVASAFGKETFVLYGNTVTDFGFYPVNSRFTILENNRLSCRPCAVTGYAKCPRGHFRCMNHLVFDFYLPW